MTTWMLWRLVKFVALAALAAGFVGSVTVPARALRLRMLFVLGVSGFVGTWVAGWMLARLTARSVAEPWILVGIAGSWVALHGAFLGAFARPGRERTLGAVLVFAGLVSTIGCMVLRPTAGWALATVAGVGALAGAAAGWPWRDQRAVCDTSDRPLARRGFRWVAWLEGASGVLLLLVAMPLRVVTGIDLDGDTGLLGWSHGVLVIVYLQCLHSTGRMLGWSPASMGLGVLAAALPGGTFVFDRSLPEDAPGSESGARLSGVS